MSDEINQADVLEPGTLIDDRFRIDRLAGVGGMATVYAGRQLALEKEVAIKVLPASYSDDLRCLARFVREGRVMAKINHPAVVRVLDLGTSEGRTYLVMELLRGETLDETLRREGALPWQRIRDIMRPVVAGLAAGHALGIIHRDLKPSNIMLTDSSHEPVKLIDYGIAKALGQSSFGRRLTLAGKIVGTPAYMAPERLMGETAHPSADVFSLGVILLELLTGQNGWDDEGELLPQMMERVQGGRPSVPRCLPGVPSHVPSVVEQAMATDPDDRPSLAELAAVLEANPTHPTRGRAVAGQRRGKTLRWCDAVS